MRGNTIYMEVMSYYFIIVLIMIAVKYTFAGGNVLFSLPMGLWAFIVAGWCQFSLSNGLHEALHRNFGKKHNEFLASVLTAYPIGLTMLYRETHMDHHRHFGDREKDPDYGGFAPFPRNRRAFIGRLLHNLSGIAAVKQFLRENAGSPKNKKSKELRNLLVVQCLILGAFILFFGDGNFLHGFFFYLLFWIMPLAMTAKFFSSARLLCEHGHPDNQLVYRTITGNFFNTRLLGAFKFHYHAEHHVRPQVPYTELDRVRNSTKGSFRNENIICEEYPHGYLNLLIGWFWRLPWTGKNV